MAATPMFWRIVRRLLTANFGRLFVILLALSAGAAVTAALLNLQIDAQRRLTVEFRALGANVIVAPQDSSNRGRNGATLVSTLRKPVQFALADVTPATAPPIRSGPPESPSQVSCCQGRLLQHRSR